MNKKVRKLAIPMAVALLMQGALPVSLMAATGADVPEGSTAGAGTAPISTVETAAPPAQVKVSLEEAIKRVKSNFTVPESYTKFTSGFSSYNERETWSLNWASPDSKGGNFTSQVDVNSGEIIQMNYWKYISSPSSAGVPQYSYAEAEDIAQGLVNKLLADRIDQLQLAPENSRIIPLTDQGYTTYSVHWQRIAKGISFPSNGVSIQVNAYDGTIAGYSLTWNQESLPDSGGLINAAKARESFGQNNLLELQYFLSSGIRPLAAEAKDPKRDALLVYKLGNQSFNGMIDAQTGEPLKLNSDEWVHSNIVANADEGLGGGGYAAKELTPAEQEEVADTAKLLTQEQAIENVKKWLEIPDNFTLRGANLGWDGGQSQRRIWSFDWNTEKSADEYGYVYARVDAATGEVISFNTQFSPRLPESAAALERTAAQAIADAFLKKIQPQRAQEVKYLEALDNGQKYPEDQPNHEFRYQRIVNGLPVSGDGFSVSVDRHTQKIAGYNMDFADVNFPAVSQAMKQEQGEDAFLTKRPLELQYVQIYRNGGLADIRLVYQPKIDNSFAVSNIMDAQSGEFLDWQGKPLTEQPRPYNFADISDSFAEKEIRLLGQAGAFGEYGHEFRPDEPVTVKSLLKAALIAKSGIWPGLELDDEELLKQAKELGWVRENLSLQDQISREFQAKLVIRLLQLEKIAQFEELFQVPYEDAAAFSEGSLGYIALTKGLGVMNIEGNKFEPARKMTRAEAAYALVKALQFNR